MAVYCLIDVFLPCLFALACVKYSFRLCPFATCLHSLVCSASESQTLFYVLAVVVELHSVQAASEIKKAQALDYLAAQQAQQQWDLERPLDRFLVPLDQVTLAAQDTAAEPFVLFV